MNPNKKLKIGIISKLWEETSPYSVGGTGAVVGILADGLAERGHDVTLFATGNSKTKAKLVSVREKPWNNDYTETIEYMHIAECFSKKYDFDIINCFVEEKACFFADISQTPTVVNISYGDFSEDQMRLFKKYSHLNFISTSLGLQKILPPLNWVEVIYHGIDLNLFEYNEFPDDYLLFLGRVCRAKGPDRAVKIAKNLGLKLIMAGKVTPEDKAYLDANVWPSVDGVNIKYVGIADFNEKIKLLKDAKALLHPIRHTEAFGMTLIESMACGTPVISFDNGAPKEIISDSVTGFIVNDENEMKDAIIKISSIDRKKCRERVETQFTSKKMVDKYEDLFYKILGKQS